MGKIKYVLFFKRNGEDRGKFLMREKIMKFYENFSVKLEKIKCVTAISLFVSFLKRERNKKDGERGLSIRKQGVVLRATIILLTNMIRDLFLYYKH